MLMKPPAIMPALAIRAWPSPRSRCAIVRVIIVGTPPMTTTQRKYELA